MGFIIHFYIILGTNLLTQGPVQNAFFAYSSVPQKRNIKWNETFARIFFWNKRNPGDLEWRSRKPRGGHKAGGRAPGGWARPHPRGPLMAPLTDFLRLYISTYPEKIQEHHEILIPPPQPSVSVISHLGAFIGARRRGNRSRRASTSTIASPMKCE